MQTVCLLDFLLNDIYEKSGCSSGIPYTPEAGMLQSGIPAALHAACHTIAAAVCIITEETASP